MPAAGRVSDLAQTQAPGDAHGCPLCPHTAVGPLIIGSNDVFINNLPAARVDDMGVHAVCCGMNMWTAKMGAPTVNINGKQAFRKDDMGQSCGGMVKLTVGSPNVNIGNAAGGGGGGGSGSSGDMSDTGGDAGSAGGGGGAAAQQQQQQTQAAQAATSTDTPDAAAQADVMEQAAEDGTPFCEDCSSSEEEDS